MELIFEIVFIVSIGIGLATCIISAVEIFRDIKDK